MGTHFQYGLTWEEVNKVKRPSPSLLAWGKVTVCADRPEYGLFRLDLDQGDGQPLHFHRTRAVTYLVEEGRVLFREKDRQGRSVSRIVRKGEIVGAEQGVAHGLYGLEVSVVYGFTTAEPLKEVFLVEESEEALQNCGSILASGRYEEGASRTFDFREKYWGTIESVVSQEVAGKRIVLRANRQSSLEFHCCKVETYFLHSGKVKVGLRIGRGENKNVIVAGGESFEVVPGLMHMRIGIEDSVIIEVSTRDDDRDSHLVEDGRTYQHIERQGDGDEGFS
jgi:mannose-6-phosphate isomerase-like protein (cupin superfamily)